jgi:hypothetical protein
VKTGDNYFYSLSQPPNWQTGEFNPMCSANTFAWLSPNGRGSLADGLLLLSWLNIRLLTHNRPTRRSFLPY